MKRYRALFTCQNKDQAAEVAKGMGRRLPLTAKRNKTKFTEEKGVNYYRYLLS